MKRIGIIHKLRGIAALMVFLFHLIYLSDNFYNFFNIQDIFVYGKNGIHIFFVISGFVIVHSLTAGRYNLVKWKSFILKRLIRLEPPYLIALFLTFAYLITRSLIKAPDNDTPDLTQLFLHIGYLIPFTDYKWLSIVFWSLAVEFQFYFLISITYPLLIKYPLTRWAVFITFWALHFIFPTMEFFYWSLVFVPGMQLALYKHKIINRIEFIISFISLPILIFFNYDAEVFSFTLLTFLLIYFSRDLKSAIFDFFGNISYSLYLVHMLILIPLLNIGIRYFNSNSGRVFMFISTVSAVIFCAYLLYRYVEMPSKQYASSLKYKDEFSLKDLKANRSKLKIKREENTRIKN
jgi:peptidoglycan/LPS O-acetylase OafA/YrhL